MKYGGSESVCKNCPAYFTVAYPLEVALNLNRVDSATVCGAIFFGIIPPAKIVLATAGSWITWCGDGGEALLLEQGTEAIFSADEYMVFQIQSVVGGQITDTGLADYLLGVEVVLVGTEGDG